MKAEKDPKTGKWLIQYRYTDWQGKRRKSMKRGFATKREAEEWAREFLSKKSPDFNMKFKNFVDLYFEDMETRLRASTVTRKHYLIDLKILPYFGEKPINEISVSDIRTWQNMMIKGDYSQTYLRAMNNEIKAIFNYAVKYYDLPHNPYGLSQYEAACKLIEDFSLPIEPHPTDEREQEKVRIQWRKEKEERDRIIHIRERFKKWCFAEIDILHDAEDGIQHIKDSFWNATPDEVFGSSEFETAVNAEPFIGYWLDILCLGTDEERIELFMKGRGEVERYVGKVTGAVERRLGRSRTDTGYGMQQCG